MKSRALGLVAIGLVASGCQSTVLETRAPSDFDVQRDGGALTYFLPSGVLPITVSYTKKTGLKIMQGALQFVPDIWEKYSIVYSRSGLSSDEITIQKNEKGLLTLVSSTTEDQTVALAKEVNAVLTQVSTLQKAIDAQRQQPAAPGVRGLVQATPPPPQEGCAKMDIDIETAVRVNVTHGTMYAPEALKVSENCSLQVDAIILQSRFPPDKEPTSEPAAEFPDCYEVVCFRTLSGFVVTVRVKLLNGDKSTFRETKAEYEVVAPARELIGYVKFARRPFVKNITTATFTDGILTQLKSTDPSPVVGFFALPVEILKSATILVEL